MATHIDTALAQFCSYLKRTKKSTELTVSHYRDYLTKFFESQHIETPVDIVLKKVDLFKKELTDSGLQSTTKNCYLIALRGFIRWLPSDERRIKFQSITLAPIHYHSPTPLSKNSITALLTDQSNTKSLSILTLRDRAILELLWSTDLRLQELPQLTINQLDPKKKQILVPGTHERTVKISNHALYYLTEYLKLRHDQNSHLFISHDRAGARRVAKQSISTRSIQRLITKQSRRAGQGRSVTARGIQRARTASGS